MKGPKHAMQISKRTGRKKMPTSLNPHMMTPMMNFF